MRSIVLLLPLLQAFWCLAQTGSALTSRRATTSGSYPIYLGGGFSTVASNIREIQRISSIDPLPAHFRRAGGRFRPCGMALKLGVVVSRGRNYFSRLPKLLQAPNLVFESDINIYTKGLDARNGGTLIFHLESVSVRAGVRHRLYYPFVAQITIGPLVYQYTSMFLNLTGERFKGETSSVPQAFGFKGMEYRLRLSVIDPAGTGGGWGFYFEYQFADFNEKTIDHLGPIHEKAGRLGYTSKPVLDFHAVNIGIIVPLALPFR